MKIIKNIVYIIIMSLILLSINTVSFSESKEEKGDPNTLDKKNLQIMYDFIQNTTETDRKKLILELTKGDDQVKQLEILSKNYGNIQEVMQEKLNKNLNCMWSGGGFISEALEIAKISAPLVQAGQIVQAGQNASSSSSRKQHRK